METIVNLPPLQLIKRQETESTNYRPVEICQRSLKSGGIPTYGILMVLGFYCIPSRNIQYSRRKTLGEATEDKNKPCMQCYLSNSKSSK